MFNFDFQMQSIHRIVTCSHWLSFIKKWRKNQTRSRILNCNRLHVWWGSSFTMHCRHIMLAEEPNVSHSPLHTYSKLPPYSRYTVLGHAILQTGNIILKIGKHKMLKPNDFSFKILFNLLTLWNYFHLASFRLWWQHSPQ